MTLAIISIVVFSFIFYVVVGNALIQSVIFNVKKRETEIFLIGLSFSSFSMAVFFGITTVIFYRRFKNIERKLKERNETGIERNTLKMNGQSPDRKPINDDDDENSSVIYDEIRTTGFNICNNRGQLVNDDENSIVIYDVPRSILLNRN